MPEDSTVQMTFWDHLDALRRVLMRVALAYAIAVGVCFALMPDIFNPVILGPTNSDFILYQWLNGLGGDGKWLPDFGADFKVDIINVNLASQFMTHISTSMWLGFLLIFPYLIAEVWMFVRPALYDGEKKGVLALLCFGVPMFYTGCAIGYFIVFPFTFRFLAQYQLSAEIPNMISLNSYIDNFLLLIFTMGIVFELPSVVWLLSRLGLVTSDWLKKYRRHAVVCLLVLAAIITPTADPFTLMVVFCPIYLLYELSIVLSSPKPPVIDDTEMMEDRMRSENGQP